jgi:hypothetical protein
VADMRGLWQPGAALVNLEYDALPHGARQRLDATVFGNVPRPHCRSSVALRVWCVEFVSFLTEEVRVP